MSKKEHNEKTLAELLADISIRVRLFRASLESNRSKKDAAIEGKRLTEHETLLIGLLGVLGGGSEHLNINDIHGIYNTISLASLSNAINSLCDKEHQYIEKRVPASTKRGYTINLTQKGFDKFNEILKNNSIAFKNIINGFGLDSEEDMQNMRRYLTNLICYFDQKMVELTPLLDKVDNSQIDSDE